MTSLSRSSDEPLHRACSLPRLSRGWASAMSRACFYLALLAQVLTFSGPLIAGNKTIFRPIVIYYDVVPVSGGLNAWQSICMDVQGRP